MKMSPAPALNRPRRVYPAVIIVRSEDANEIDAHYEISFDIKHHQHPRSQIKLLTRYGRSSKE